jgi:hypothetical protein
MGRIIQNMKDRPLGHHPLWVYSLFGIDLLGFLIFLLGLHPGWFGLDRSHVIGYLHALIFLIGLAMVVVSTYSLIRLRRPAGHIVSVREDIGIRLAATGYVFATLSGTADFIGLGSNPLPNIPVFGPVQSTGFALSVIIIAIGFFLFMPILGRTKTTKSSR